MWNLASSVSSFANGLSAAPARPAASGRHSTGSCTVSTKSVAQKSMRSALAERGGVIRKADGFEVFYGINEGAADVPLKAKAVPQSAEDRDGYEIFYDIKQTPAKVEKIDWTTKHPNMTPEKENKDSPQKDSAQKEPPKKSSPTQGSEKTPEGEDENLQDTEKEKGNDEAEEAGAQQQSSPVVEPSVKPPTICAFNIATPATSFAPPLVCERAGLSDGEPGFRADLLEGEALARDLMNRLGGNFNRNVEAYSIHTPAASFAPPQIAAHKVRANTREEKHSSEDHKSTPALSAIVLEDDAPKNSTPRGEGEGKHGQTRRVVKEVRAVATRAMAGIPERPSANGASGGYPSQTSQAPRTFTITAARFPSAVAGSGRLSTGSTMKSIGSTKGRTSVPGNFRPTTVTAIRRGS